MQLSLTIQTFSHLAILTFFSELHDINLQYCNFWSELCDINGKFWLFSCKCESISWNSDLNHHSEKKVRTAWYKLKILTLNSYFFSELHDINLQLRDITSELQDINAIEGEKPELHVYILKFWLYNSQLWVYHAILWKMIKSRYYLLFIQWQKWASIHKGEKMRTVMNIVNCSFKSGLITVHRAFLRPICRLVTLTT